MTIKLRNIINFKFISTKDVDGSSPLFWDWLFAYDSDSTNIAEFVETVHAHSSDCIRHQIE